MAGFGFDDPAQAQDGVIEHVAPIGRVLPTVVVAGARLFGKTLIGAVVEFAARDAPCAVLVEVTEQTVGTRLQSTDLGIADEDAIGFEINRETWRVGAPDGAPVVV